MKDRLITLLDRDIYYSVNAETYNLADTQDDKDFKLASAVRSDTNEELDRRLVKRWTDVAVSALKGELGRFIAEEYNDSADNTISTEDHKVRLYVEDEFQDALLKSIASSMHDYVVASVLASWYSSLGMQQAGIYAGRLPLLVNDIKQKICSRAVPKITR